MTVNEEDSPANVALKATK